MVTIIKFPGKDLSRGRVKGFVFQIVVVLEHTYFYESRTYSGRDHAVKRFIDETISHQVASFVEANDQDRTLT